MIRVPANTALLCVFKAFLKTDHTTEATGKTIPITISKNGATTFSNPAAGSLNATEMAFGWYKASLGAGDTDTVGPLAIRGAEATIDDIGLWRQVSQASSGLLDVNAELVDGTVPQTAGDIAAAFLASAPESGMTMAHAMQIILANVGLKKSGMATTTGVVRNFGDTKNRCTYTMDVDGNISAVTFNFD
jgi:hypothetical protein